MSELWSLPEAFAWVIKRSEDAVSRAAESRISCMGLLSAAITEADGDEIAGQKAFSMRDDFHKALHTGRLKAVGLESGSSVTVTIPPEAWRGIDEFKQFIDVTGPSDVGSVNYKGEHEVVYRRVTVDSSVVKKLWPAPSMKAPVRKRSAGPEVRKFIGDEIKNRGGFISQRTACEIVRAQFPDVGRQSIRDIVKQLTKNEKKGPRGPRK